MTVAELIELLGTCDPDATVIANYRLLKPDNVKSGLFAFDTDPLGQPRGYGQFVTHVGEFAGRYNGCETFPAVRLDDPW